MLCNAVDVASIGQLIDFSEEQLYKEECFNLISALVE